MSKTEETTNDNKQLVPAGIVDEVIAEVGSATGDERRTKFCLYYMLGLPVIKAAEKSGFSLTSGGIYQAIKRKGGWFEKESQAILSNLPARYQDVCKARLLTIAEVEGKALAEYNKNPKLAIERPALLKQMKQSGGVLSDDNPQNPTINISTLQVIRQGLRNFIEQDDTQDAEFKEA